jgi:hypothetical protein
MLKKRHVAMGTGVCIQSMDDEGARGIDGIPNTFAAVSVQNCLAIETSSLAAHASRESFNHRRPYVHSAILDLEMDRRYIQEWKNSHG